MPSTYKAIEVTSPGKFNLVEREVVAPKSGQVRIRVQACGVCHSDSATVSGQWPGMVYPRVPGHEAIGLVEEVGPGESRWKVGQRVGVGYFGGEAVGDQVADRVGVADDEPVEAPGLA